MPERGAVNRQILLASRPEGLPDESTFDTNEQPIPEPGPGELLIEVDYLSLDPAMRGWMRDQRSYVPPVAIGEVMRAGGAGRVIASNHPDHAVGDVVTGTFGVQEYAISDGRGLGRADTTLAPLPTWLGLLGMPGLTAYFGLFEVGRLDDGETVVVSGAAGAVGSVVGQLAKIRGARVIGIAGGEQKCRWLTEELGFDAAIDDTRENVHAALREHARDGIDVYFDNVGGEILDAALARLAMHARVVICGAISQYNATAPTGPRNYLSLLVNRATMQGMVVFDYARRYREAIAEMAGWLAEGRLVAREHVVQGGIERFPEALDMLWSGANTGKLVLQLSGD
jgi:NADPH-dependent curcumin reductase CurA